MKSLADKPFLGQGEVTPYPVREILMRTIWSVVQATVFRWSPRPLHFWRNILLCIFGAEIEDIFTVRVFPTVKVTHPWKLHLSARCVIGPSVIIYNLAPIIIKRGATLSQNVHLCAGTHDYTRWAMPLITQPIVICENAWVAADAFVGPGVTIGELSVIGARSVVLRDQPANTICAGHPCHPIKSRPFPVTQ